jgi:flavin reductase (DIM6/NTAB) family NADH-FMN oxidoreductase RutF
MMGAAPTRPPRPLEDVMTSPSPPRLTVDFAEMSAARRYFFMISAIVPRPIAWVSSLDRHGVVNLAPFSFFQGVCADPPTLMLAISRQKKTGEGKDSLRHIEETGEFVVNVVTESVWDEMLVSSLEFPAGTSELERLGLETFPAEQVAAPCVTASPVNLECRLAERVDLTGCVALFGRILRAHVEEQLLDARGSIDAEKLRPLARLGGSFYAPFGGAVRRKPPEGWL